MRPSPPKARLWRALWRTRLNARVASFGRAKRCNFMSYTYVLLCIDTKLGRKHFYIGSTEDLKNRVTEHKAGEVKTTKSFDKISLVYYEACLNKTDARKRELQLKTGFGRGYLKRRLGNYLADA